MEKYYKALLYTTKKPINKGKIYLNDLLCITKNKNIFLIIEESEDKTIEYRTKEEIPFIYFDKVVINTDKAFLEADVKEDISSCFALGLKTALSEISKEEADKFLLPEEKTNRLASKIRNMKNREKTRQRVKKEL